VEPAAACGGLPDLPAPKRRVLRGPQGRPRRHGQVLPASCGAERVTGLRPSRGPRPRGSRGSRLRAELGPPTLGAGTER
jgi:hypothetical protein